MALTNNLRIQPNLSEALNGPVDPKIPLPLAIESLNDPNTPDTLKRIPVISNQAQIKIDQKYALYNSETDMFSTLQENNTQDRS